MKPSHRIRQLREAKAVGTEVLASRLAMSVEAYEDIERYEDELATTASILQVQSLARELGVEVWALFTEESPIESHLKGAEISMALERYREAEGKTVEELEGEVGWELRNFHEHPDLVIQTCPAMFLQDIAAVLKLNWLRMLPTSHAA